MAILKMRDVAAEFTSSKLNEDVAYYWGLQQDRTSNELLAAEVTFPIHINLLKGLMNASPTRSVALRVDNFENKANVTATWISYDTANPPSSTGDDDNLFYAILDQAIITKITQIGRNPSLNYPYVSARLAVHNKQGNTPELFRSNFFVYFNRAKIYVHRGGIGGEPEGSGAVVR